MPIVRRTDCVPLRMVVCPVVAFAMLEIRVAICVHCVENVAVRQHSPHSARKSDGLYCTTKLCRYVWIQN